MTGESAPPPPRPTGRRVPVVPRSFLKVARAGETVIIRIHGLGNVHNAVGLWDFCEEMIRAGCARFAFDLSECRSMDSTFMGTLVGLATRVAETDLGGWVCAVNARPEHVELLQIVGADRFLRFKGPVKMENIEMETLVARSVSPELRLARVKKAHENLVQIDARNQARFGAFLHSLSTELGASNSELPPPDGRP